MNKDLVDAITDGYRHKQLDRTDVLALLDTLCQSLDEQLARARALRAEHAAALRYERIYVPIEAYARTHTEIEIDWEEMKARKAARRCLACNEPSERLRARLCAICAQWWRSCCSCKRVLRLDQFFAVSRKDPRNRTPDCRMCRGIKHSRSELLARQERLAQMRAHGVSPTECAQYLGYANAKSANGVLCQYRKRKRLEAHSS